MPDGTQDAAYERSMQAIGQFMRSAWKPITQEGDGDLRSSKFAGKPWLSAGESWPCCANCNQPMRFFLQINLQELPAELGDKFGTGILQLFYCTNEQKIVSDRPFDSFMWTESTAEGTSYVRHQSCDDDCEGWQPFSSCQLVRIVQANGVPAEFEIPQTGVSISMECKGEFPPRLIVEWQQVNDYPNGDDIENYGIQISLEDQDFLYEIGSYQQADKLAGWPAWIQGDDRPDCPLCQQKMEQLIFQVSSDDNVPFLWGDMGNGYIFQCSEHKSAVAFLYQCG